MTYTVGIERVLGSTIDRARFVVPAPNADTARAIVRRYLRAHETRGFKVVSCEEGASPLAFPVGVSK